MRRAILAATAAVAVVLASCLAVTGSTDGYKLEPPSPGCTGRETCGDPTGAGGTLCCLTVSVTNSGAIGEVPACLSVASCPPILAGLPAIQLCTSDAECQGSTHCVSQSCRFSDAGAQSMGICGLLIPGCTVTSSGAGNVDAASDVVDAGGSG